MMLNLTNRAINKRHIIEIIKKPEKYYIHMVNFSFEHNILLGSGGGSTDQNIIEVCKKENEGDYNKVTRFISGFDE